MKICQLLTRVGGVVTGLSLLGFGQAAYGSSLTPADFPSIGAYARHVCTNGSARVLRNVGHDLPGCEQAIAGGSTLIDYLNSISLTEVYPGLGRALEGDFAHYSNENDSRSAVVLNDMTATLIGHAKDQSLGGFDKAFTGTNLLVCEDTSVGAGTAAAIADRDDNLGRNFGRDGIQQNNHYRDRCNDDRSNLVAMDIRELYDEVKEPAGVFTTSGFARAYYDAGTNRAAYANSLRFMLHIDLLQVKNINLPSWRIRRDVEQNFEDATYFPTNCYGCHAHIDPGSGSFAHFDLRGNGTLESTQTGEMEEAANPQRDIIGAMVSGGDVVDKYFNNQDTNPLGYNTTDATWINNLVTGPAMGLIQWSTNVPGTTQVLNAEGQIIAIAGDGINSWTRNMTAAFGFAVGQVKHALKSRCGYESVPRDSQVVVNIAQAFVDSGYNYESMIKLVASQCNKKAIWG